MNKTTKSHFTATIIAVVTMGITSGSALAGGFLDVEFKDAVFSTPLVIDNPYWPLNPDATSRTFTYIGGTEDECVIDRVSVTAATHTMTTIDPLSPYFLFTALEVEDTEWVFEDVDDCDPSVLLPNTDAIKEKTLDWYAQDDLKNIWYLGEASESFEDECGPYPGSGDPECLEGSWEAGTIGGEDDDEVLGEAGIVVPSDEPIDGEPLGNGAYYMQEVAFEAEDMAKILRQHAPLSVEDGVDPGDYENCRKVKEWNPFEHGGSVEHKWYCHETGTDYGPGLVLIEGIGGGPTEVETLVEINPAF